MATETALKQASAVMMSINDKNKAVSLGSLHTERWDADKALNIAGALIPLLDGSLSYLRHNPTYSVEES